MITRIARLFVATVVAVVVGIGIAHAEPATTQPPGVLVCWNAQGYPIPQDRAQYPTCPPGWTDHPPTTTTTIVSPVAPTAPLPVVAGPRFAG